MKPLPVVLAAVALAAAGSASSSPSHMRACGPLLMLPRATPAADVTLFGHIASLTRRGARFELRFDPALWLTGHTAARAKLEDTGSAEVPNDYWIRDLDHRLLSFWVPQTTPVTVLTHGTCTTRASAAALARSGTRSGFWIHVHGDTARSLDQQYQP